MYAPARFMWARPLLGAFATMSSGMVKKAAAQSAAKGEVQMVKSVCTHCSVGCTVVAEVRLTT